MLIIKLAREEARRFPALTPEGGWQPADLEDLVGNFLVERVEKVTANLLALATDEASVGRLLRKSIRHWLIDQARRTAAGAVRRTVEKVLASEVTFEKVPTGESGAGRWRLAGTNGMPWSGAVGDLVAAARAVPNVRIPKWTSATRRPPIADRLSIAAVIHTALAAAGGSLEVAQLVEVFLARFPAVLDPAVTAVPHALETDVPDHAALTPEAQMIAFEDEVDAAMSATGVVAMLSPQERELLRRIDNPSLVQEFLGCGKSQASHRVKRLKEKLAQLIGDGDVRAVGLEVIWLCGGPVREE